MDILERLAILTIADWVKMTIQIQISILVVSKCMLIVFRPPFEVVKEGRILKKIKQLNSSFEHYLKCIF